MKIVILRHGKPNLPAFEKLKACELYKWIESYNSAGIDQKHVPPEQSVAIAADCKAVVCSDLPRSIESAKALNIKHIYIADLLFREIGLPYPGWDSPRLTPYAWAGIFRMLWFFGYCSNGESFGSARLRAKACAQKLKEIAAEYESVLFVGHGLINRFIAKELLSSSWHGPKSPGRKHWAFGVYKR